MLNQNEKLAIKRVIEIYPKHIIVFEDNSEDNDCSFSEFFKSDYILIEVADNCSQIRILRKDRRPCPACVCHYINQFRATKILKMKSNNGTHKSKFIKKSLEIIDKLDDLPNDLYNYADEQIEYLDDEMFYQVKELSEKIQQFTFELSVCMIELAKKDL